MKIKHQGRHLYVGNYENKEEAAWVYDAAARMLHGPDAVLNFDREPPLPMRLAAIRHLSHLGVLRTQP